MTAEFRSGKQVRGWGGGLVEGEDGTVTAPAADRPLMPEGYGVPDDVDGLLPSLMTGLLSFGMNAEDTVARGRATVSR